MKVSLLNQQKRPISGCCFNSGLKEAPCGTWFKEEHIFTAIPSGVRFIEFIDGGSDCKNWAGFYGSKMVGAFAGVITNSEGLLIKHLFTSKHCLIELYALQMNMFCNSLVTCDLEFNANLK